MQFIITANTLTWQFQCARHSSNHLLPQKKPILSTCYCVLIFQIRKQTLKLKNSLEFVSKWQSGNSLGIGTHKSISRMQKVTSWNTSWPEGESGSISEHNLASPIYRGKDFRVRVWPSSCKENKDISLLLLLLLLFIYFNPWNGGSKKKKKVGLQRRQMFHLKSSKGKGKIVSKGIP